jgi:hypothetical protein
MIGWAADSDLLVAISATIRDQNYPVDDLSIDIETISIDVHRRLPGRASFLATIRAASRDTGNRTHLNRIAFYMRSLTSWQRRSRTRDNRKNVSYRPERT